MKFSYLPRCPTCGSHKVRKGVGPDRFICYDCGRIFEKR